METVFLDVYHGIVAHGVLLAGHEALIMWVIGKVLHQFLELVVLLADEIDGVIEREPPSVAIRANPKANGISIAILIRQGYLAALAILLAHICPSFLLSLTAILCL